MTAKEKENAMTEQALMPVDPAPAQATRAVAERRYGFSENHGRRA